MRTRGFSFFCGADCYVPPRLLLRRRLPPTPASRTAVPAPTSLAGTTRGLQRMHRSRNRSSNRRPQPPARPPPPEKKGPPVVPPAAPTPEAPLRRLCTRMRRALTEKPPPDRLGSVYIPVDSWMYPALTRLYGMGFVDTMYLGMRPYTRRSVLHMLLKSKDAILSSDNEQAQDILAKIIAELECGGAGWQSRARLGVWSGLVVYAISGNWRADTAGQLPSGTDDQQRLWTTVSERFQRDRWRFDG